MVSGVLCSKQQARSQPRGRKEARRPQHHRPWTDWGCGARCRDTPSPPPWPPRDVATVSSVFSAGIRHGEGAGSRAVGDDGSAGAKRWLQRPRRVWLRWSGVTPRRLCCPQSPGPNRGNSVHAAEAADFRTLGTLHSPGAWWAPPHNVLSLKPPPRSQATRRATRRFPEGHDHHGPRKAGPASCLLARCSGRCSPRTGFGGLRLVCQASRPPRPRALGSCPRPVPLCKSSYHRLESPSLHPAPRFANCFLDNYLCLALEK